MESNLIDRVREGMKVYDRDGKEIGSVEEVYLGAVSPLEDRLGVGPQTTDDPGPVRQDNTILDDAVRGFAGGDDVPEVVRNRLQRSGYIRIDSGVLARDCFALPEQIDSIGSDRVQLNTTQDNLIRP